MNTEDNNKNKGNLHNTVAIMGMLEHDTIPQYRPHKDNGRSLKNIQTSAIRINLNVTHGVPLYL